MQQPVRSVDVRRGADRSRTRGDGIDTRHSFSFGPHYDPDDVGFGVLVAHNEDRLSDGAGYDRHRHRDTEIVTWVLDGVLVHEDSAGRRESVGPGTVQRLTAGRGVEHSERHPGAHDPAAHGSGGVHLVQTWLTPDEPDLDPSYARAELTAHLADGRFLEVASGDPAYDGPGVRLRQRHAALHVARLRGGDRVALPEAAHVHLFVARGTVALGGDVLEAGDAARLSHAAPVVVSAEEPSEVLAWAMSARTRDLLGREGG